MRRSLMIGASTLTLLCGTTGLSAQQAGNLRVGLHMEPLGPNPESSRLELGRAGRGTHWKEGALILGVPAAIGMFLFSSASDDDSPDSSPLRDGLVAGLIAGAFGGLIGFFFPKE